MPIEIIPADYLKKTISLLSEAGISETVKKKSDYMRNLFPFYGVTAPQTKPIFSELFKNNPDLSSLTIREVRKYLGKN